MTEQEKAVRAFYHEELARQAEQLNDADAPAAESFYIRRSPSDHIHIEPDLPIAELLRRRWEYSDPALVEVATRLAELQQLFPAPDDTQNDVSPFLYAMF